MTLSRANSMQRTAVAIKKLALLAGLIALQGCSTPALEAYVMGRPEELNQLLVTRQVDVNAYLPLESGSGQITPLCAMLGSAKPVAVSSIDFLIENGANLNLPCRRGSGMDGDTALDFAFREAFDAQRTLGPYSPGRSEPSTFPVYAKTITKLLRNGAKSNKGLNSIEAINAELAKWNASNDKFVNDWKADILREEAESKKNSFFNAETLSTVAAMAGTATTIYANNNNATPTLTGASLNTAVNRNAGAGSAAVRENNANTSLQNMAGMDTATANARSERSKKLDDIVVKLANDGGMKVLNVKYQCAPSDPVQTVSVPYKSQACATAKENWFTVYACNDVDRMSAATEKCRQACGDPSCDEGL
jgi:hypothetical protein